MICVLVLTVNYFDACVSPILDYGAEVWGITGCKELEKVQTNAARIFLGVDKYTPGGYRLEIM